jgi:hypothetical protein
MPIDPTPVTNASANQYVINVPSLNGANVQIWFSVIDAEHEAGADAELQSLTSLLATWVDRNTVEPLSSFKYVVFTHDCTPEPLEP